MSDSILLLPSVTKQEKFFFFNTLTGLAKALEGQYTTVDLRNECCVTGKITHVSGKMNLEMEDVAMSTYSPAFLYAKEMLDMYIYRKNLSAGELLEKQMNSGVKQRSTRKQHTFKAARAKRYNKEIIQEAFGEEVK
ncbi:hypothetical protein NQ318_001208 [Aromia moschata]|uniref:Uncharacterized protein n=1 Tax=Aromia moschata TaxID=1265417 RepID=A0AAV8ZER6_9CUCU|nr:hypothetical protein NQ318_001208 [Aromia moschata]